MVKFGKYFRKSQVSAFSGHYLDYKFLKQFIRSQTNPKPQQVSTENQNSGSESQIPQSKLTKTELIKQFCSLLDKELKKIYMCFVNTERDLYVKINQRLHCHGEYFQLNAVQIEQELDELDKISNINVDLAKYLRDNITAMGKILKKFDKKFKHFNTSLSLDYPIEKLEMKNSDLLYIFQYKIIDEVSVLITKLKNDLIQSYHLLLEHPGDYAPSSTELQENKNDIGSDALVVQNNNTAILQASSKGAIDKKGDEIQKKIDTIESLYIGLAEYYRKWNSNLKIREFSSLNKSSLEIEGDNKIVSKHKLKSISNENKWNVRLTLIQKCYISACMMFVIPNNFSTLRYDFKPEDVMATSFSIGPIRYYAAVIISMTPLGGLFSLLLTKFWISKSYKYPMIFSSLVCVIGNILYVLGIAMDSVLLMCFSRFIIGFGLNTRVHRRYMLDFIPKRKISLHLFYLKLSNLFGAALGPLVTLLCTFCPAQKPSDAIFVMSEYVLPSWIFSFFAFLLLIMVCVFYTEPVNTSFNAYGEGNAPIEAALSGDSFMLDGAFIQKDRENLLEINDRLNQCNEENKYSDTNLVAPFIDKVILEQRSPNGVVAKSMYLVLLFILVCNFTISSFTLNVPMFLHDLQYNTSTSDFTSSIKDLDFFSPNDHRTIVENYEFLSSLVEYGKQANRMFSFTFFLILFIFTVLYWFHYYYISNNISRKVYMLILALIFLVCDIFSFFQYDNAVLFLTIYGILVVFGYVLEDQVIYFYTKIVPSDFVFLCFNASTFVLFIRFLAMFFGFVIGAFGFALDNVKRGDLFGIRTEFNIIILVQIICIGVCVFFLSINMKNFKEAPIRRIMRKKDMQSIKRTEF